MKILFLHGWTSVPGGRKPTFLKDAGLDVLNPALPDDDFDEAVRIAQAEFDQHGPDVVVGSSRGGAVAMNINVGITPLVLLCPAWKNWGTATKIKPNSVILHSRADEVIPFADAEELVSNSGLPPETLIEVGNDHRLADPEPLKVMLAACKQHTLGASFSRDFPLAFHVIPLHLFKPIWTSRTLLSKADLRRNGTQLQRATTAAKDTLLGFDGFVHFYLPKNRGIEFSALPILQTQLREATKPPFPHVVIEVATSELRDRECTICNFNIALSKPKYEGSNGFGIHNRTASAESVLRHWQGFRASNPSHKKLRRSFWHEGLEVPVIAGSRLTLDPSAVGAGMSARETAAGNRIKVVELLLRSPFHIPNNARIHVFSEFDARTLQISFPQLPVQIREDVGFEWYRATDRVSPSVRHIIEQYFGNENHALPELDFDQVR